MSVPQEHDYIGLSKSHSHVPIKTIILGALKDRRTFKGKWSETDTYRIASGQKCNNTAHIMGGWLQGL